jgi:hypothetical protein
MDTTGPPPSYTDEDAAILLGKFPPPQDSLRPLAVPVCLPQTVSGYDSPFARAYNPELVESGIGELDWLKFIDGLNIAIVCISSYFYCILFTIVI